MTIPVQPSLLHPALVLACGMVCCFLGERLFRILLALSGFLAGWMAAESLLGSFALPWPGPGLVAAGLLCAVLALLLLRVSFFLAGAAAGWITAWALFGAPMAISIAAAVVSGVLAAILARRFIAVLSALAGALTAAAGAASLTGIDSGIAFYAASALLWIAGSIVQLRHVRR
jgi:hypothetical protein